jgi:hypothetical protein
MRINDQHDNTPAEVARGRLTAGVAQLLEREMDGIFQGLLHDAWHLPGSPVFRSAQQANRIVVLCRNLVEEIEAYELAAAWEPDGDEPDTYPF